MADDYITRMLLAQNGMSANELATNTAGATVGGLAMSGSQEEYFKALTEKLRAGNDPWSMQGTAGLALGGLQAGAGLLGTLDAMKTAKLQRGLLSQQYDTNAEKMQSWRDNKAAVNNAFRGGLARSSMA